MKARYILEDAWKFPQLGTEKQHRSLVTKAKELGYDNLAEFVAAYDGKLYYTPEGNINSLCAHNFFNKIRYFKLRRKGETKGEGNDLVSTASVRFIDERERSEK